MQAIALDWFLTSKVSKPKHKDRRPIPHDSVGEGSQRVSVRHLVVEDSLVSKRICSIVCLAVVVARAPLVRIVAASRGIILTRNTIIHLADVIVRVYISRKANAGWWRTILLVCDL